jgi:hypothetical protein
VSAAPAHLRYQPLADLGGKHGEGGSGQATQVGWPTQPVEQALAHHDPTTARMVSRSDFTEANTIVGIISSPPWAG